jgi:hypothetical protein
MTGRRRQMNCPELLQFVVARFKASVAAYLRASLFSDDGGRGLTVGYRCFGTKYRSYL